jgi:hypothetical protein
VDPHCFDADPEPDPAQILDADPDLDLDADPDLDQDPGGEGVGQPKMCIPPAKILGTPLGAPQANLVKLHAVLNYPSGICKKGSNNFWSFCKR